MSQEHIQVCHSARESFCQVKDVCHGVRKNFIIILRSIFHLLQGKT
ncbi:rCG22483, isoform CRA_a [Rattus norvegicus]|uniref:RCG22483, isoform CRA_a n=1 Tax=Rattus norvegicus TaxID=10116 RepID=A6INL8_RAT|nr:rCG22483, isoform CRA_a [Rattus norvegicus]